MQFVAGICFALPFATSTARAATLDEIAAAWRGDRERMTSGEFQWKTELWLAKGSVSKARRPPLERDRDVPSEDVIHSIQRKLVFAGSRLRCKSEGPAWSPHDADYVSRTSILTWDGETFTQFDVHSERPYVFLGAENNVPYLKPFHLLHAPFWESAQFEIADKTQTIDGQECVVVQTAKRSLAERAKQGRRLLKHVYCLSPARNYAIVRHSLIDDSTGKPINELQIQHKRDALGVWIPTKWIDSAYKEDRPTRIETSTLVSHVVNPTVPDTAFQQQFPDGTIVTDLRNSRDFLLQPGGVERTITRDEIMRGVTFEELMSTPSGQAGLVQVEKKKFRWPWIAAGIFAITLTLAILFYRRRRGA